MPRPSKKGGDGSSGKFDTPFVLKPSATQEPASASTDGKETEEHDLSDSVSRLSLSPRLRFYKYNARTPERALQARMDVDVEARHDLRLQMCNTRRGVSEWPEGAAAHLAHTHLTWTIENVQYKNEKISDAKKLSDLQIDIADDVAVKARVQRLYNTIVTAEGEELLQAVREIRRLLSIESKPPIDPVIDVGLVPVLVDMLKRNEHPALQFEAAWALTNVSSGAPDQTCAVVNADGVTNLIALLSLPNIELQEQAMWGLGNIAGDNHHFRDIVLERGGLDAAIACFRPGAVLRISFVRQTAWAIGNMLRGKPKAAREDTRKVLPLLNDFLSIWDEEVLCDALWALSHYSDGPNDIIQDVIDSGVLVKVVPLLSHPAHTVALPALRVVGNVVTGDTMQTNVVLQLGALPRLAPMITAERTRIRKEACWTVSNITAGDSAQIQQVIDAGILPLLVGCIRDAPDVRKEVLWALANLTENGLPVQIIAMVNLEGVVRGFKSALQNLEVRFKVVVLTAIHNILRKLRNAEMDVFKERMEALDVIGVMKKLQEHEDREVRGKVQGVLAAYFEGDGDDNENE